MNIYQAIKPVATVKLQIRGLQYALHTWGDISSQPVFLLHGWADTGMSFQFLADAMSNDWFLIAPDWRGFGDSGWSEQGYWFPDYLADLDAIVDHFNSPGSVKIVGHSMGGNVASLFAGIKPERVSHLAVLDVFGLAATEPDDAPKRYELWLEQIKSSPSFTDYSELEQLASHITKLAPGIASDRAHFIAQSWSRPSTDGDGFSIKADPAHKRVNPILYRREEARSCWRQITAKTLFLFGEDSKMYQTYLKEGYDRQNQECFANLLEDRIRGTGHMLHLQKPEILAVKLEEFLNG